MGISDRFKRTENTITEEAVFVAQPEPEFFEERLQTEESVQKSGIDQYLNDETVSQIVIVDNDAVIYRDGKLSEKVILNNCGQNFIKGTISKYVQNDFIVSGVCPPVSEKVCVTFEKIQKLTPADLIRKQIINEKNLKFIEKCIQNKKNILVANNDNLFNTIIEYYLSAHRITLLQELAKVKNQDNIIAFTTESLSENDFSNLLDVAASLNSEYLITDIKDESRLASVITQTHEDKGKIFNVYAHNAHSALFKVLNMIMNEEHCNEKIAKSKLLNSFNYIIDSDKLYLIAPAKTAVLTLKEVM